MTKLCSWWRHLQQRSPRPSGVNHVSSFEDTGAFMNRIDEIVRGSFSSTEKSAEVHEVAFNIKWQIQQCLRDELDGNPDLGPVLTVTGNSLHAWATSCHEYIQATWKEAAIGEQFLIDLEILLGKNFPSLGQYNNDHSAMRDYLFFFI
ncbi:hypothetical protein GGS24DRAFT_458796 [Hypoxylon argillaceum]|nr:hypothetical protein GGS24DRAFT_458796 [Hypoxylon argillaceum]